MAGAQTSCDTRLQLRFGVNLESKLHRIRLATAPPAVTLIYAERSLEQVREVMEKLG
jgi:hypothetical protein